MGRASSDRFNKSMLAILQKKKFGSYTQDSTPLCSQETLRSNSVVEKKEDTRHTDTSIGSLAKYVRLCRNLKMSS